MKRQHIFDIFLIAILSIATVFIPQTSHAYRTGFDGGFFIATDEWDYILKFGGGVIPQLRFNKSKTWDTQFNFQEGAYLNIKGEFAKKGKAEFTLGHGTGNPDFKSVNIGFAIIEWRQLPEFEIKAGTLTVALDMDLDGGWMLLNDPPITRTQWDGINDGYIGGRVTPLRSSFGTPYGLGLQFSGKFIKKLLYQVNVINGNENGWQNNPNKRFDFGGRFQYTILGNADFRKQTDYDYHESPALAVNVGSCYQGKRTDPNTNADISYYWTSSAGVGLRYRGFALTTEGYYRRTKILNVGNATWARPMLTDIGYYGALGYFALPKKLELAAEGGQVIRQGPDNDSWQFGGGINYYFNGFNFKTQLSYTFSTDFDDITGTQNNNIHTAVLSLHGRF